MRRNSSLLPHMVYFSATQKRVFHEAAKRSLTSLNSYIRDLLTRDVELRARQGEPYFEGLRDELHETQGPSTVTTYNGKIVNRSGFVSPQDGPQETASQPVKQDSNFITDDEHVELCKRGLFSESSGESIRAALKEIRNANGNEKEI